MKRVSVGVAFVLAVVLDNAISGGYSRDDAAAQYRGASPVLAAGSSGNPWALPDPKRNTGRLPEYITNPKYATDEDRETKLNHGRTDNRQSGQPVQQPIPQGYGAPQGLPAVPNVYAPYGYYPGYPMYPGFGALPGMGVPYTGDTGFGGNPLITPYGNIYGTVPPNQGTQPSSDGQMQR